MISSMSSSKWKDKNVCFRLFSWFKSFYRCQHMKERKSQFKSRFIVSIKQTQELQLITTVVFFSAKDSKRCFPCLVSELWGKALFSPLSMMLATDLSYMAFIMLRYILSNHTLMRIFIFNGCWFLPNAFFASLKIKWFSPFILLMWCLIRKYWTILASLN